MQKQRVLNAHVSMSIKNFRLNRLNKQTGESERLERDETISALTQASLDEEAKRIGTRLGNDDHVVSMSLGKVMSDTVMFQFSVECDSANEFAEHLTKTLGQPRRVFEGSVLLGNDPNFVTKYIRGAQISITFFVLPNEQALQELANNDD